MKSRPQRTTKRKSQERGVREGLRAGRKSPTSSKRLRLHSPEEQLSTSSKKGKKKKGMDYTPLIVLMRSKLFKFMLAMQELWNRVSNNGSIFRRLLDRSVLILQAKYLILSKEKSSLVIARVKT